MALHTHTHARSVGVHADARVCVYAFVWVMRTRKRARLARASHRRLFLTIARWAKSLNQTNEMKFHAAKKIHIFAGLLPRPLYLSDYTARSLAHVRVEEKSRICERLRSWIAPRPFRCSRTCGGAREQPNDNFVPETLTEARNLSRQSFSTFAEAIFLSIVWLYECPL